MRRRERRWRGEGGSEGGGWVEGGCEQEEADSSRESEGGSSVGKASDPTALDIERLKVTQHLRRPIEASFLSADFTVLVAMTSFIWP